MKIQVFNSFCKIFNVTPEVNDLLARAMTYRNDIKAEVSMWWGRYKYHKKQIDEGKSEDVKASQKKMGMALAQIKKLEENEYVCLLRNNQFPTGLLNIVKAVLEKTKNPYELNDMRLRPEKELILRWVNKPHPPRYYQEEMIAAGDEHGRGVFVASVGSGKSLVMMYLIKKLAVKTLVIVPSRGLSQQLKEDFEVHFGKKKVEIIDSKKVRSGKELAPIRIVTVQTLASLQKTGDLGHLVDDVNAMHIDEIHHAGAESYTKLLPDLEHIYYRFGYTGTFLRNDAKILELWGVLSNILYRYSATQAIEDGYLTPMSVKVHTVQGSYKENYQKEYNLCYGDNAEFLSTIESICSSSTPEQKVLILVSKKEKCGGIIHNYLNLLGIEAEYISGDNTREEISDTISRFNSHQIRILIGSSVIGEGIDVRAAHHLVMAQGGKSEIVMVQAVGRLGRLDANKPQAWIHDFEFTDTKHQGKHLKIRLDVYKRNFGVQHA